MKFTQFTFDCVSFCVLSVENERRKQLAWLDTVLRTRAWKVAELARRSGVSASAFSKFKNDPLNLAQMEASTIALIEEASGIPYGSAPRPDQFEEPEGSIFQDVKSELSEMIRAVRSGKNGVEPWLLNSRGLEAAGYMPGDVVVVDRNLPPKPGDVVCAQVFHRGRAETVFRIYEEPFLVAATLDPSKFKPLLVDNSRVLIVGVVVASMRERRAA